MRIESKVTRVPSSLRGHESAATEAWLEVEMESPLPRMLFLVADSPEAAVQAQRALERIGCYLVDVDSEMPLSEEADSFPCELLRIDAAALARLADAVEVS